MLFKVSYCPLYENDSGEVCEQRMTLTFMADNHQDAARAACRWIVRHFNATAELYKWQCVGSVRLSEYLVDTVDDHGVCNTSDGPRVLEWKRDYMAGFVNTPIGIWSGLAEQIKAVSALRGPARPDTANQA